MQRRIFLNQLGKLGIASSVLPFINACSSTEKQTSELAAEPLFNEFGLQLWTIKEDMAKDTLGSLKTVAEAGYSYVESFGGEKGIFWGYEAKEFEKILSDLGLKIKASHCNPAFTTDIKTEEEFKKLASDAASIGVKYLINPFPGEIKTKEEWMQVAEGLNRQGEICKNNGLKVAYHNHHFEFLPLEDGTLPENLLLDNTDPELVDFELDLYWNVKAGQNPNEWFEKHKNRFKLCHIKDLVSKERIAEIEKTETPEGEFWPLGASCVLGKGQIDFKPILEIAKANGMEYFIAEQERFDNSSPLKDIVSNAAYLKDLIKV